MGERLSGVLHGSGVLGIDSEREKTYMIAPYFRGLECSFYFTTCGAGFADSSPNREDDVRQSWLSSS